MMQNCKSDVTYQYWLHAGAFLPDLCDAQRMNPQRSMMEFISSGAAPGPVSEIAPGPTSEEVSSPALAPASM